MSGREQGLVIREGKKVFKTPPQSSHVLYLSSGWNMAGRGEVLRHLPRLKCELSVLYLESCSLSELKTDQL